MGSSAEQVQMEMVDGLAAIFAGVDHDAIALRQLLVARNLPGDEEQMPQQRAVRFTRIGQ